MYCNHCGSYLGDADRFCTRCGAARPRCIPPAKQQQYPQINQPLPNRQPAGEKQVPTWRHNYAPPAQMQTSSVSQPSKSKQRREGEIGRNLFAILASLLILIGVGIFIATIYKSIPLAVKVIVIYAFGIALLGVGLLLYRRNKNYFWLGIASCGLAELLICIIESYSYFAVLTLPAAVGAQLLRCRGAPQSRQLTNRPY